MAIPKLDAAAGMTMCSALIPLIFFKVSGGVDIDIWASILVTALAGMMICANYTYWLYNNRVVVCDIHLHS